MLVSPKGRRPDRVVDSHAARSSQQPARSTLSPSPFMCWPCSLFPSCPRRRAAPAGRRTLRGHAPRTQPRARPALASSLAAAAAASSLHLVGAKAGVVVAAVAGLAPVGLAPRCAARRERGRSASARPRCASVGPSAAGARLRLSKHQKWSHAHCLLPFAPRRSHARALRERSAGRRLDG